MFQMRYIDCFPKEENAFAQFGTFGHSILEKYYAGELKLFELSQYYNEHYKENVKLDFPPNKYVNLANSYHKSGVEYFDNFEDDFEDYEVLGIEEKIDIEVGGYHFTGYIDLTLRNNEGIAIVDHKSKSKFKSKKERTEYLRQLYLYAIHVYKKYGVWPIELIFNMFRNNTIHEEPFSIDALEEAKQWFIDTIAKIYNDNEFPTKEDSFFCNYLCDVRSSCVCSDKYLG